MCGGRAQAQAWHLLGLVLRTVPVCCYMRWSHWFSVRWDLCNLRTLSPFPLSEPFLSRVFHVYPFCLYSWV